MTDTLTPVDEPGSPAERVGDRIPVVRCGGFAEALLLKGCLVAAGIPATIGDHHLMMQGGEWLAGGVGGVRVLVPSTLLGQAQAALAEFHQGAFELEGDDDPALRPTSHATDLALWAPDMASLLSLWFTPIFGAALHFANSRRLADRSLERGATRWLLLSLVATGVSAWLLHDQPWTLLRPFGVSVMAAPYTALWYLFGAHPQSRFIGRSFGTKYRHRSLLAAIGVAAAGLLAIGAVGAAMTPD